MAADKEARERLQKLANDNVSDSDTSLFDSHFSYENKEPKSEVQKEDEFKSFIAKANSKRQDTNANPPTEAGRDTKIRGIAIDLSQKERGYTDEKSSPLQSVKKDHD